ncbi:hypothetical protein FAZ95_31715 [Trinickia violacea]|uniref:Uncharacterized protein n=1 Tax=Trinickia violacea TaxID=2571746 RepID=A0A4P8IWK0_9BURK|nr:hypothetical protein [Trinickia violacea]QCP53602.1 hypothetical protein FAZ95_31715 [Trinickia violacea]
MGDISDAKGIVMALVNEIGFDSVDGGPLEESWRQQRSTPAYCCDYDAEVTRKALAAAVKGDASRKRDQVPTFFARLGSHPSHDDVVNAISAQYNRVFVDRRWP